MSEEGSHPSRHQRGLDVYRTIRSDPSLDLEQTAQGMASMMGPIAAFSIDHVLGDIWSRPGLARRDRSLVSVTALTCLGCQVELRTHLAGALHHGVAVDEIEELMLHLCGYAGYPRALDGMRTAMALFTEREDVERPLPRPSAEAKSDAQRRQDGAQAFKQVMGWEAPTDVVVRIMEERLGALGDFAIQHLMGEIWSRPQLSRRDRSLVTLAALISLGKATELRVHIPAALRHGMSREEVDEVILQLSLYLGYPTAVEAKNMSREILATLDAQDASE
ncbi:MAG: carboxymuconolactone decarboxylase family protein [Deltaproteobacteria bacterium]|nr:carboxymuconolactone decarboxylase family protein [Deltaproteobacteria bacterium]MBW2400490.1 carboxymuconolactone decarboxylase family protein [Deltaproteobacteria bacterium]